MTDRRMKTAVYVASAALSVAAVLGVSYYVWGEDSGVAMCREMAADSRADAIDPSAMNTNEYQRYRKAFQNSRHSDLRDDGTGFIDLTWQVSTLPDDEVLTYAGEVFYRYAKLVGSCAAHDVYMPSLDDLTKLRASTEPK